MSISIIKPHSSSDSTTVNADFIGSPQGCVLSPLLYIIYSDDCRSQHENRYILKFADDSAIVSLLSNEESETIMVLLWMILHSGVIGHSCN